MNEIKKVTLHDGSEEREDIVITVYAALESIIVKKFDIFQEFISEWKRTNGNISQYVYFTSREIENYLYQLLLITGEKGSCYIDARVSNIVKNSVIGDGHNITCVNPILEKKKD